MKLLCFGDSNTYGYDPRSFLGDRYPAQYRWVDLLAGTLGWDVINEGQNGREIPRREGELLAFRQMLARQRPLDLLVVLLGTNDLLQGKRAQTVARRMETFLEQVDLERSKILLLSPPPMFLGQWVPSQNLVDASRALNSEYKALSERLGVRFADAGVWNVSVTFDGVHFTEEGHIAFAEGLSHYLNKGD